MFNTQNNKQRTDQTLSFNTLPAKVIKNTVEFLKRVHGDDKTRVHPETVVTAFKSQIAPGSAIIAVPRKVYIGTRITFRIALRGKSLPVFASMENILAHY